MITCAWKRQFKGIVDSEFSWVQIERPDPGPSHLSGFLPFFKDLLYIQPLIQTSLAGLHAKEVPHISGSTVFQ